MLYRFTGPVIILEPGLYCKMSEGDIEGMTDDETGGSGLGPTILGLMVTPAEGGGLAVGIIDRRLVGAAVCDEGIVPDG